MGAHISTFYKIQLQAQIICK